MGNYVGELQERWQFPSDHLPIGLGLDGFNFASWNALDSHFMSWIEKNTQGLSRSMIAAQHVYLENSKMTLRDYTVANLIIQMLNHPTCPKHLLALQECSEPLFQELKQRLPERFATFLHQGKALLIDESQFEIISVECVTHIFELEPTERTAQHATLSRIDTGERFHVVNVHLSGNPLKPSTLDFAIFLAKIIDSTHTTLAMGDMNCEEQQFAEVLKAMPLQIRPFLLCSPYNTCISPSLNAIKIDHLIIHSERDPIVHTPDQVMIGLSFIAKLLSSPD